MYNHKSDLKCSLFGYGIMTITGLLHWGRPRELILAHQDICRCYTILYHWTRDRNPGTPLTKQKLFSLSYCRYVWCQYSYDDYDSWIFFLPNRVLRRIEEYFTYTTATTITVRGNRTDPGRNPRPPVGCCRSLPHIYIFKTIC